MSIQVVPMPATGAVGSRPRKEPLVDTECYPAGVAPTSQLATFSNFAAFINAPTGGGAGLTKQQVRDTNLSGQGGLPAAHHHYMYGIRAKIRAMGSNLNAVANAGVPEQINRLRELMGIQFKFATTEYISTQADEFPNGTGPQHIGTTFANTTVLSLPSGVPDKRNFKDVTVSGRPIEIKALENFRVLLLVPQIPTGTAFLLTTDLFVSPILEGLLLRGLN